VYSRGPSADLSTRVANPARRRGRRRCRWQHARGDRPVLRPRAGSIRRPADREQPRRLRRDRIEYPRL